VTETLDIHTGATRLLARAFAAGKLSHSYLIAGPEGAGKKTLALKLAAATACAERRFPPCGRCPSCRKVERGEHPDVHRLEPEGRSYKIDDVRDLIVKLQLHSFEGGWKAAVIADVDRLMLESSQNAFLKTLEEPPSDTVLVLTCVNLQRVLPTIISRCQLLRLGPMPREAVRQLVGQRGLTASEATLVAEFAHGNARKALEMDLPFVFDFRRQLLEKLAGISREDRLAMLEFAEVLAKTDHPQEAVLDLVAGFYDDVLYLKLGRSDLRNRDLIDLVAREARQLDVITVLEKIEAVLAARGRALGNARPQINWEILIMTLKGVEGAAITRS